MEIQNDRDATVFPNVTLDRINPGPAWTMKIPPNDLSGSDYWNLEIINTFEGWYEYYCIRNKASGMKHVIVAVLDTGVNYNHVDLKVVMCLGSKCGVWVM